MTISNIPHIPDAPAGISILPCVICLSQLGEDRDSESQEELITALACQHLYHKNCLADWILKGTNGGYNKCPQCRGPIDASIMSQYPLRPRIQQSRASNPPIMHGIEIAAVFYLTAVLTLNGHPKPSLEEDSDTSILDNKYFQTVALMSGYIALSTLNAISYCRRPNPDGSTYPPLTRIVVKIGNTTWKGLLAAKDLFQRFTPIQRSSAPVAPIELTARSSNSASSPAP
ncbi:MAG: hypothetical protein ACI9S8_001807 [Chlamydiales bacterium]|jgi:hypothetical protein